MFKRSISVFIVLLIFATGFFAGCNTNKKEDAGLNVDNKASAAVALPNGINTPHTVNASGTIEIAFSPNGGGTESIIKAIGEAKKSIRVQAYSFTSSPIAKALAGAKKRGVDVRVILDKSQETEKYSSAKFFANNSIPTKIDHDFQIAHSKIMIIDEINVVTGSFNFTKSAEQKNAENILVIRGNKELADLYVKNWEWRWDETQDYK